VIPHSLLPPHSTMPRSCDHKQASPIFLVSLQSFEHDKYPDASSRQRSPSPPVALDKLDSGESCEGQNGRRNLEGGLILRRSYADFARLDLDLREELEGRSCARALPNLPDERPPPVPSKRHYNAVKCSRTEDTSCAGELSDYMSKVIRIPEAVHSVALEKFLSSDNEEDGRKDNEESNSDRESSRAQRRSCIDYLLPREERSDTVGDDPCCGTIKSRGSYTRTVSLPPGWWLVWRFRIVGGTRGIGGLGTPPPVLQNVNVEELAIVGVEFKVTVQRMGEAKSDESIKRERPGTSSMNPKNAEHCLDAVTCFVNEQLSGASNLTLPSPWSNFSFNPKSIRQAKQSSRNVKTIHSQAIYLTSTSPESECGSYRNLPRRDTTSSKLSSNSLSDNASGADSGPPDTARLVFSALGHYFHRTRHQIRLDVAAVPHDAFRAACVAAHDQTILDDRLRRAPLLRAILESDVSQQLNMVVVQEECKDGSQQDWVIEDEPRGNGSVGHGGDSEIPNVDLHNINARVSNLRDELASVRVERDIALSRLDTALHDRQLLQSEKCLWVEAEMDMNEELVSLRAELEKERKARRICSKALIATKDEVDSLQSKLQSSQLQLGDCPLVQTYEVEANSTRKEAETGPESGKIAEKCPKGEEPLLSLDIQHPDPRLNAQLTKLRARHRQLVAEAESLSDQITKNTELQKRIEDAIRKIVKNASSHA